MSQQKAESVGARGLESGNSRKDNITDQNGRLTDPTAIELSRILLHQHS